MISSKIQLDYLKHRLKAKTRHGVHSPFTYRLVDKIIYDFHAKNVYANIEELRSELLLELRRLNMTDSGAGLIVKSKKQKTISTLARNGLKSAKIAQLIYRLSEDIRPLNIIELGSSLGITTAYIAKAAPEARILLIENCSETAAIACENLEKLQIQNTEIFIGDFSELLPNITKCISELDLILVNGRHTKEAICDYFQCCLPKLSERSIMIIDGIYQSKEMKEAWTQIKAQPEVSVTIDLFHIGLLFVKKGQAKEDFFIRF
jgi:predicted O-methyltransferase YrrM